MSTSRAAGAAYDAGVVIDAPIPAVDDEQSYETLRAKALVRIEKARAQLADAVAYLARLDAEQKEND